MITKKRRNNRILQKFYDAKYIDTRTNKQNKKVSASELNCGRRVRNKSLNEENLKKYRGKKMSKGRSTIRRNHYLLRPDDVVVFEGKKYKVKSVNSKGRSVELKDCKKATNPKNVKIFKHCNGYSFVMLVKNEKGEAGI
jgi:hypothetical protein